MHRRKQRGLGMVYVVACLGIILGFCSLAVDYGRVQLAKNELSEIADGAARAAAAALPSGINTAQNAAISVALMNSVAGQALVLDRNADIEFGVWAPPDSGFAEADDWTAMDWSTIGDEDMADDDGTYVFTPLSGSDIGYADAVRVTARRASSRGTGIPLLFAQFIGVTSCDAAGQGVAALYTDGPGDGVVGIKEIDMKKQAVIDSYDATLGNYGGSNVHQNGNLRTNGHLRLHDNAIVKGDVYYGKDHIKDIGAKVVITGITAQQPTRFHFKSIKSGTAKNSNNNSNVAGKYLEGDLNFHLDDHDTNVVLPGGTYYFHDFHIDPKAKLTFTGPTTLYLTGNADINGQMITYQNKPANLLINVINNHTFKISGDRAYYASIYAPKARVKLDHSADLFGAVVANSLKVGNASKIHYDESLRGSGNGTVALVQ